MELNNRDFLSILMSIAIIMNIMMSSSPPIFSFFYKKGKKKAAGKEMRDQEYLYISTEHWRKAKQNQNGLVMNGKPNVGI